MEIIKSINLCCKDLSLYDEEIKTSRESCLECVTKHFSSAAILASEIEAGYKEFEYLFIGHLHEAHEESKEFPKLYCLLVEARRKYQREQIMPNFKELWEIISETREEILKKEK